MHEEFVKELKLVEKTEEEFNIELIKSIIKTKTDLENANKNYEFAEGELIDYYLYQIKANQSKLNYLLKKAKRNGIIIDMIKEIEIRKMKYLEDTNAV
ncbi:MAG: YaaL family protein [Clostridia bacterium]|nr:YaaL family protein [Clostridia bacterium]